MLSRDDVLRKGFCEVPVVVSGVRRKHKFIVRVKPSPEGPIPVLETSPRVPEREMLKVANKLLLPVTNGVATVFPTGMSDIDFVNLI